MPLTGKGRQILGKMKRTYGLKKGKQVFYASARKGKLQGVEQKRKS